MLAAGGDGAGEVGGAGARLGSRTLIESRSRGDSWLLAEASAGFLEPRFKSRTPPDWGPPGEERTGPESRLAGNGPPARGAAGPVVRSDRLGGGEERPAAGLDGDAAGLADEAAGGVALSCVEPGGVEPGGVEPGGGAVDERGEPEFSAASPVRGEGARGDWARGVSVRDASARGGGSVGLDDRRFKSTGDGLDAAGRIVSPRGAAAAGRGGVAGRGDGTAARLAAGGGGAAGLDCSASFPRIKSASSSERLARAEPLPVKPAFLTTSTKSLESTLNSLASA